MPDPRGCIEVTNRQIVACPAGHQTSTSLRGRSTTCGQCGRRVYVRADGTTRHKLSPAGSDHAGRRTSQLVVSRAVSIGPDEYHQRRYIERPSDLVDRAEYDKPNNRTRLFDVDDNLIGWTDGDLENDWPDDW